MIFKRKVNQQLLNWENNASDEKVLMIKVAITFCL